MQNSKEVKLVLLGDAGVGKSSILLRFVTGDFKEGSESTLGASFMAKLVQTDSGQIIKFQIWDTAGQEKFHALAPMYYKDAQVAVIVYDITNKESFNVAKNWVKELKQNGPEDLILAFVGNKIDLLYNEKVSSNDANNYAKEIGALFNLTSAKENEGINDLFNKISVEIEKAALKASHAVRLRNDKSFDKKRKNCC